MELSVTFSDNPALQECLYLNHRIGKGKFSVYQAYSESRSTVYAIKVFPKDAFGTAQYLKEKLISKLQHPNIVQNISIQVHNTEFYGHLTEFAKYSDLSEFITSDLINTEILARTYFHHLINGLEHAHTRGIAHLDLKPSNLIIDAGFILKIIDFDQAQRITNERMTSGGTEGYRAPEVLDGACRNLGAADVYSAGILLFALKTGKLPFLEIEDENGWTLRNYNTFTNKNSTFWRLKAEHKGDLSFFSQDFIALINGMLNTDPEKRFTIKQIKESQWFQGPILEGRALEEEMSYKWKMHEIKKMYGISDI